MVMNFHIQINIYGNSLIKIVQEDISLEKILKEAGIEEFVIVEIPHQPTATPVLERKELDYVSKEKNDTEVEENEEILNERLFCSTPLYSDDNELPVLLPDLVLDDDCFSTHSSSNEVHTAVLGTVDSMISVVESTVVPVNNRIADCSLFSTSPKTNTVNNSLDENPVDNEKAIEFPGRVSTHRRATYAEMDISFQSCESIPGDCTNNDVNTFNRTNDSSMLQGIRKAMTSLDNLSENIPPHLIPCNQSVHALDLSLSEELCDSESRSMAARDFICQYPDCQRKLRVSWKKGYGGLREHVRQHTNEIIRSCTHCQYGFRTLYQLRKHHQSYHSSIRFIMPKTSHEDNVIIHKLLAVCFPSLFLNNSSNRSEHNLTSSGRIRRGATRKK